VPEPANMTLIPEYVTAEIEADVVRYLPEGRDAARQRFQETTRLYVDEGGVVYEWMGDDELMTPSHSRYLPLRPGHRLDRHAPYVCPCGNRWLEVFRSDAYETSARCPECGVTGVVHSG
jgi:hypothetical protein